MANRYDFEMAWASIYWTFEDNAFDSSKVYHAPDGSIIIGQSTFVEVPF